MQEEKRELYLLKSQDAGRAPFPGNEVSMSQLAMASTEQLVAGLRASNWHVRAACAERLGVLGEQEAVQGLLAALHDEHEAVRAAAVAGLGQVPEKVSLDPLLAALRDPDWHVREVAVLTLGRFGERVPVALLQATLRDSEELVCQAARQVLQQRKQPVQTHQTDWPAAALKHHLCPEHGEEGVLLVDVETETIPEMQGDYLVYYCPEGEHTYLVPLEDDASSEGNFHPRESAG